MARVPGVVQIRQYSQRSNPSGPARPKVRGYENVPSDFDTIAGDLGAAVGAVGEMVERGQEVDRAVENIQIARDEDDARAYSARAVADATARYTERAREIEENAPDGWRDLTRDSNAAWAQIDDEIVGAAPTEIARNYVSQHLGILRSQMVGRQAERENDLRRSWRLDGVQETVQTWGSVLAADPTQYDRASATMRQTIGDLRDITADDRRDLLSNMENSLAAFTVGGMVDRDPQGSLRALRDPEAQGAVAQLTGTQRLTMADRAQAEIDRRAAQWRSSVSQSVEASERLWELGIDSPNAPSVETVTAALGPMRALSYEASRATSSQYGRLATMGSSDLQAVATATNPRTDVRSAVLVEAERRAAVQILEQRATDPMQYQVRHGLTQPADLVAAFNAQDWGLVNGILNSRAASAQTNGRTFGMAPLPLTQAEAAVLGPQVRAMTDTNRQRLFRNWSAWMGGDTPAYRNMMAQLFPDSPTTAYSGYLIGVAGENGARDAAIVLRGETALGGGRSQGESNEGGTRSRILNMPDEDRLRDAWRQRVGEAYAGTTPDAQGHRAAEAHAYEVFRAAYAGQAEGRMTDNSLNATYADRAAQIATGGIVNWNGRRTVTPTGMSPQDFSNAVADGFSRWSNLRDVDPRDFTLVLAGESERGTRYHVLNGDAMVRSPTGNPVEIEVRRGQRPSRLVPAQ